MTVDMIQQRCKTTNLLTIKNLNLFGQKLEDISLIKEMSNIEIVSLSLNNINSLKEFQHCKKLSELYLRKNSIKNLLDIKFLAQCPNLKVLWLSDNPITLHPLYRQYTIKMLPNLVKLDS